MACVRSELGPEALILAVRRVGDGVEVTAALEPNEDPASLMGVETADPARLALLSFHDVPAKIAEALRVGDLTAALARTLRFESLELGPGSNPLLLAGPPGSGKTLTVARLATRLVLRGTPPLVINADARRAGAREQLGAYTRLLGVRLLSADDPILLAKALVHRIEPAAVLIDSPGVDIFNTSQREELKDMAVAANAMIAAVLPAGLHVAEAAELARAFVAAGATLLVSTRLDIARRLGSILAAAAEGLALTEAGIGAGAADGLVSLDPDFLSQRMLERHR
ncbi:MAG: GTP-binding protein [Acetobacteraceae bacterium]|nr:GTP-binding protein [Acetobacteraceae bacterium]